MSSALSLLPPERQACPVPGQVGKAAAGRLLDGVIHDGVPGAIALPRRVTVPTVGRLFTPARRMESEAEGSIRSSSEISTSEARALGR